MDQVKNHLGVQYTTGGPGQIFTSNGNLRFVVDNWQAGSVPLIQQAGFDLVVTETLVMTQK